VTASSPKWGEGCLIGLRAGGRFLSLFALLLVLAPPPRLSAQGSSEGHRSVLSAYSGQQVLVVDTTSGTEQFQHQDALLLYRVTLQEVNNDYIIVTRNVEGDKRSFLYPLSVIRRVVTRMNGRPLRPIVIEMY
jgi:hypothetical protein